MKAGDIKPTLNEIIARLKEIARNTNNNACCTAVTSSGVNTSVPAGFGSVSIVLTSGSINVTMSDGTVYPMTTVGESLIQSASPVEALPSYVISGTGTWKWVAIK